MKVRQAIALAAHVAARNATLPILSHVRIAGRSVSACDLETQIEIPTELPPDLKDFCVHAARLTRILKALPEDEELKLKVKDKRLHLSAGATRYELNTLAPEDFPDIAVPPEEASSVEPSSVKLAEALAFCAPAMASKDIRYYLNGLHAKLLPGRVQLTATDGHRMHRAVVEVKNEQHWRAREVIVPRATVERLMEIAAGHGELTLALSDTLVIVETPGETLKAKLVEGQFPQADRVIPHDRPVTGQLPRKAFAAAVRRMAQVFNADKAPGVLVHFQPDGIELTARNAENELAAEHFPWAAADKAFTGLELGFNWQYLADSLDAFTGDDVNVHLGATAEESLYLTDNGDGSRQAVVMPMRV